MEEQILAVIGPGGITVVAKDAGPQKLAGSGLTAPQQRQERREQRAGEKQEWT